MTTIKGMPPKRLIFWAIWIPVGSKDCPGVFVREYGGQPMLFPTKRLAQRNYGKPSSKAKFVKLVCSVKVGP